MFSYRQSAFETFRSRVLRRRISESYARTLCIHSTLNSTPYSKVYALLPHVPTYYFYPSPCVMKDEVQLPGVTLVARASQLYSTVKVYVRWTRSEPRS